MSLLALALLPVAPLSAQSTAQGDVQRSDQGTTQAPAGGLGGRFVVGAGDFGMPKSPILTIHSDRLYSESAFGRRVAREMEARSAVLTAENRNIEAELRKEEQDLAIRRRLMEAEAFRALAQAFDQKVQETRRTQENKYVEITLAHEEARRAFQNASLPVIEQILIEAGAAVILEQSSVLLSADAVDVTDLAISRINAILGEGDDGLLLPQE